MLALRLPPELEARLDALAKKSGRTKSSLAREAVIDHIEDLEDLCLAEERLPTTDGTTIPWHEVRAKYFDDGRRLK